MNEVLTIYRRCLACLWAAVGLWIVFTTLNRFEAGYYSASIALAVGAALAAGAGGLFFNKRWGRISVGCLLTLVVLWSADMLLFIAFRGLGSGRWLLLCVVVALALASISTWCVLAATRP
jgi:hypothetical protein